jgi:hypothetical protein
MKAVRWHGKRDVSSTRCPIQRSRRRATHRSDRYDEHLRIGPSSLITTQSPFFTLVTAEKEDGARKVLLKPWRHLGYNEGASPSRAAPGKGLLQAVLEGSRRSGSASYVKRRGWPLPWWGLTAPA